MFSPMFTTPKIRRRVRLSLIGIIEFRGRWNYGLNAQFSCDCIYTQTKASADIRRLLFTKGWDFTNSAFIVATYIISTLGMMLHIGPSQAPIWCLGTD